MQHLDTFQIKQETKEHYNIAKTMPMEITPWSDVHHAIPQEVPKDLFAGGADSSKTTGYRRSGDADPFSACGRRRY